MTEDQVVDFSGVRLPTGGWVDVPNSPFQICAWPHDMAGTFHVRARPGAMVPPGRCPSAVDWMDGTPFPVLTPGPHPLGITSCELLAGHAGRHCRNGAIWGPLEMYSPPELQPDQALADPPASHVHRWMPQTSLGTFYYCAWKAADGSAVCTAVTRYPASELPYGLNVPVPASFMIHPSAGLLVEQLSADVNDEPPVHIEEHTHDWENLGSTPTSSGDLYRCTHLWEAGDRCDALFYAMTDFGPPQGQIGRRVTRPEGTSKTQTLPEGRRGL